MSKFKLTKLVKTILVILLHQSVADKRYGGEANGQIPLPSLRDRLNEEYWQDKTYAVSQSNSLSRALNRLEKHGLLIRERNGNENGKTRAVVLTEQGEIIARSIAKEELQLSRQITIRPEEISANLRNLAQWMIDEGQPELVGHRPRWFWDASRVIEQMAKEKD